jgi:hypothetical protein
MPKRRVNINLDAEMHDRLKAVLGAIPGASVSHFFNDVMVRAVPTLEEMLKAANAGDVNAIRSLFGLVLADGASEITTGVNLLHKAFQERQGGEETT